MKRFTKKIYDCTITNEALAIMISASIILNVLSKLILYDAVAHPDHV